MHSALAGVITVKVTALTPIAILYHGDLESLVESFHSGYLGPISGPRIGWEAGIVVIASRCRAVVLATGATYRKSEE